MAVIRKMKKKASAAGKKTVKKPARARSKAKGDMYEVISRKAYELYEKRGGCHGDDQADWYEAEKLVMSSKNGK